MKDIEKDIFVMIGCAVFLGFIIDILGDKILDHVNIPLWIIAYYNLCLIVAGMIILLMILMAVQLKYGKEKFTLIDE